MSEIWWRKEKDETLTRMREDKPINDNEQKEVNKHGKPKTKS